MGENLKEISFDINTTFQAPNTANYQQYYDTSFYMPLKGFYSIGYKKCIIKINSVSGIGKIKINGKEYNSPTIVEFELDSGNYLSAGPLSQRAYIASFSITLQM